MKLFQLIKVRLTMILILKKINRKEKEISKFDKDLSGAMNKIRNGYQSKDAKQIKRSTKLTTVSSNISS